MTNVEEFELLILGGGKAGKTLAMDMAHAGRRVAVIERGLIGGSCISERRVNHSAAWYQTKEMNDGRATKYCSCAEAFGAHC